MNELEDAIQRLKSWVSGYESVNDSEPQFIADLKTVLDAMTPTSNVNGVEVKTCPDCGGVIVNITDTAILCGRGSLTTLSYTCMPTDKVTLSAISDPVSGSDAKIR